MLNGVVLLLLLFVVLWLLLGTLGVAIGGAFLALLLLGSVTRIATALEQLVAHWEREAGFTSEEPTSE